MINYGEYLKALRQSKGLTLREVEKETNVSNAYLSQLESNKIKQPSPTTLYKLAGLYGIKYEKLMEKVGYPVPKYNNNLKIKEEVYGLSKSLGDISYDEEIELLDYLKFIRNRKK
ncbi:MAG: XRE family transcriptional regulator [Bacteroidetes bacterium]|nr:MAG: XRE family transcriptional regulator [Bacteroidota bacterium]